MVGYLATLDLPSTNKTYDKLMIREKAVTI